MRGVIASLFRILFKFRLFRPFYFGLYKKIFRPYNVFRNVTKTIIHRNNLHLSLDLEDWIAQNIYFLNRYEDKELKFVEGVLKPGDCFVDIGANIGLFSLVASKKIGETGTVIAFEPFKRNYEELNKNLQLNKIKNVNTQYLAISDKAGILELKLDENEKNYGMVSAHAHHYTRIQEVKTVTLDSYLSSIKELPIRLIKIDIEGGEYVALKGMEAVLKKYKPTLLIEINPPKTHDSASIEQVEALLFKYDYKKYFLNASGQLINQKLADDNSHNYVFA